MKQLLMAALIVFGFNYHATAQSEEGVTETTTTETTTTTTEDLDVANEQEEGKNRWGMKTAGAYIEPMLIFAQNTAEAENVSIPGDTDGNVRDAAIGARLGLHLGEIFFLAADGRYGQAEFNDSFYDNANAAIYNYGATAGLQTPFYGVRLWGTYILGGEFDPAEGAQNVDLLFSDATGYRVGAGIHVGAVSINLEYQDLTYDTTEIESVGNFPGAGAIGDLEVAQTGYALSLGFPFEL